MKNYLLLVFCFFFTIQISGQTVKVTGSVMDNNRQPLTGVSVYIQNDKSRFDISNANGNFSIRASKNEKIVFSYVGYIEKIITINNPKANLNVILDEEKKNLDEVVVIGYGTAKKKDVTGAISSVSASKLEETPAASLNQALQGKSAGVQVQLSDNSPGGGVNVLIRGIGSINTSTSPIYVVDGIVMEGTLNNINVDDIASIDILKDASSAAIYGSRAANGVVMITTKKGVAGRPKISYNSRFSFQSPSHLPKMLTAQQLGEIRIEGNVNSELDNVFYANPNMSIDDYRSQFNTLKAKYTEELPSSMFSDIERQTLLDGKSYDWYKQISHGGFTQDQTLSISGGTEKSNYYISANYYNQRGIIQGSSYRRISFRVNLEQQVNNWLKVGVNSNYYDGKTVYGGTSIGAGIGANPMYPFTIDGESPLTIPFYTSQGQNNPILSKQVNNDGKSHRYSMNAYLLFNFNKYLSLKSSVSLDNVNNFGGYFAPSTIQEGLNDEGIAQISNDRWTDVMQENSLTFSKLIKDIHRINVMVGNTIQENNYFGNTQYGTGFATNVMGYNNIGSASKFPSANQSSNKTKWQLASFIARFNYAYKDKYIFTFTDRYDGNSKYGEGHKWGLFSSFAAAWRISDENFMKDLKWIDDMKIRAGWGQSGNSSVASYSSFTKLSPDITVDYQGNPINTIQNTDQIMGNPNLKWEKQEQWNFGVDFLGLNNRLHFTLDLYKKNSKDLILLTPLPVTTGYLNIYSNVGELENKGIEISIGGRVIDNKNFKWDVDFNWASNKNKLIALYGGLKERMNDATNPLYAGWWVGKPLGTIYTYRYQGIWQWNDDRHLMDVLKDGVEGGDTYYPGENKIADLDGEDGVTTKDREIVGYTDPKGYGGFSTTIAYKNLSLNLAFNYVYGNDVFNRSYHEYTLGAGYGFQNMMTDVLNRWSVNNQKGNIPRAHSNNLDRMLISSRLVEDGSYLRLKTATLNYRLPKSFISKFGINDFNVYLAGENLFTLTHYKGADPESVSYGYNETYPNAKAFVLGLNVSF
jgi:TonB-linked SusC/RagA family outer membrane protein